MSWDPHSDTERTKTSAARNESPDTVARPDSCPSCQGKVIDTLAKVVTVTTTWRCCKCAHTWTLASLGTAALRHRR
jgi:hypothetical protein